MKKLSSLLDAEYINGGGKNSAPLNQVITLSEASDYYAINESTLRTALSRDSMRGPVRKTESIHLLTHEALMRSYGISKNNSRISQLNIFYNDSNFNIVRFDDLVDIISQNAIERTIGKTSSNILLNDIIEYYPDEDNHAILLILKHPITSSVRNAARNFVAILNRNFGTEYFKQ